MILTTDKPDNTARVVKKFDKMKGARVNWESHWEQLAKYILPDKNDVYKSNTPGERHHNKIFTGMPVHANEELAAALHSMLTNPSTPWFGLSTGDRKLDSNVAVKGWLQHVSERMLQTLNQSNFQTQIHEVYIDLGCFGTSLMLIEKDDERVINFLSRPIYMAYIEENHKGIVDTVAFEKKMTIRQIAQEFGTKNLTEDLLNQLNVDDARMYTVVHMVEPRDSFNPVKKDVTNKPFASTHVIRESMTTLKESGFDEMPYIVARWSKISGEVYGRSPAMKALPDVKMLNALKKVVIQGAQKVIDPALQVPDDGVLLPLKTAPGSINYYRAGSKDRIEPLITGSRPDIGEGIIQAVEEDIRKAFFLDQLHIREADRMTATEIVQRRDEQLRKLGPILGRQHFELLRPLIDRVFNIMMRSDMFDPAPSLIEGKELEVQYTSQIAKAQRTADSDDLSRVFGLLSPLAETKPELLDNLNSDAITRDTFDKFGMPAQYLHSEADVKAVREQRAQAAQQQAEMQEAEQAVDVAGKASQIGE